MYGNEMLVNALTREREREARDRRLERLALAARAVDSRRSFPLVSQLLALWYDSRQPRTVEQPNGQHSTLRLNLRNE